MPTKAKHRRGDKPISGLFITVIDHGNAEATVALDRGGAIENRRVWLVRRHRR